MSDCSTNAFMPPRICGSIHWSDGTETPMTFARFYSDDNERKAEYVVLDGERYERVDGRREAELEQLNALLLTSEKAKLEHIEKLEQLVLDMYWWIPDAWKSVRRRFDWRMCELGVLDDGE